jgi:nitroreductase
MSTSFRNPTHPIDSQFLERWSPRAFSDKAVTEDQVLTLIEAARWAPSASNLQPWRFIYALHGTPEFDTVLSLLVPFNEGWAKHAGALIFAASVTTFDGERQIPTHSFDTGAAAFALALQAHKLGLIAHGMGGLEYDKAPLVLGLPDNLKLEAAYAIGYKGDPDTLPDFLKTREGPSQRQDLSTMAFKGKFSGEVVNPTA